MAPRKSPCAAAFVVVPMLLWCVLNEPTDSLRPILFDACYSYDHQADVISRPRQVLRRSINQLGACLSKENFPKHGCLLCQRTFSQVCELRAACLVSSIP